MELRYCEKCGDIIPLPSGAKASPSDQFLCQRCVTGKQDTEGQGSSEEFFQGVLQKTSMNLFSSETVAIRRKEQREKEVLEEEAAETGVTEEVELDEDALDIAATGEVEIDTGIDEEVATSKPDEAAAYGAPSGSALPARTARKLQFRCLHCRAILMVRPVEMLSRLICPKCKGNLFMDKTGIVSKRPPGGTAAKDKQAPAAKPLPMAGGAPPEHRLLAAKPGTPPAPAKRPGSAGGPEAPAADRKQFGQTAVIGLLPPGSSARRNPPVTAGRPVASTPSPGTIRLVAARAPAPAAGAATPAAAARPGAAPKPATPTPKLATPTPKPATPTPKPAPAAKPAAPAARMQTPGSARTLPEAGSAQIQRKVEPQPAAPEPTAGYEGWGDFKPRQKPGAPEPRAEGRKAPAPAAAPARRREEHSGPGLSDLGLEPPDFGDDMDQPEEFTDSYDRSPTTSRTPAPATTTLTEIEWTAAISAFLRTTLMMALVSAPLFIAQSFLTPAAAYPELERIGEAVERGIELGIEKVTGQAPAEKRPTAPAPAPQKP